MITMIWAQDCNRGIGWQNQLPWHIPSEMKFFKTITTNHVVVMGYNTFLSLKNKPLVNRTNVVLTHKTDLLVPGFVFFNSVEKILTAYHDQDLYIIGGKQIYNLFQKYADVLIISQLSRAYQCDTFMDLELNDFTLVKCEDKVDFTVLYYHRKTS